MRENGAQLISYNDVTINGQPACRARITSRSYPTDILLYYSPDARTLFEAQFFSLSGNTALQQDVLSFVSSSIQ